MLKIVDKNRAGFTLLELLVVVVIIGILAAIALPQYKKVVDRAKLTKVRPLIDAILKSQEIYFISHGKYALDLSDLDIDVTNNCIWGGSKNHQIWCPGMVLNNAHSNGNAAGTLQLLFCPSEKNPEQWTTYMTCHNAQELNVLYSYDNVNNVSCSSTSDRGSRLENMFCH